MNTNTTSAKSYPITAYLASRGIYPEKETGNCAFYKSPLRNERTASFLVYTNDNRWIDFGQSERAQDVISLVMLLEQCSFIEAVGKLQSEPLPAAAQETPPPATKTSGIDLQKVKPLENRALLQYMESRGINPQLVRLTVPQLQEAYYHTAKHPTGKPRFAIAFQNDRNGYELRNQYFKGCHGSKAITTVPGKAGNECIVFEGFFDFLSYMQYRQSSRLQADSIILNSVTNTQSAITQLQQYAKVFLLLDNDSAGHTATETIRQAVPHAKDIRHILNGCNDVNDWLLSSSN